jgi:penicillin-binding protein 1B
MRVWSGIFSRLPSAPLRVADKGLDWQWVAQSNTTDATCPGARRFPFVAGFAPQYQPCVYAEPDADAYGQQPPAAEEQSGGGWRDWFGIGRRADPAKQPPPPPPAPSEAPAPAPEQP